MAILLSDYHSNGHGLPHQHDADSFGPPDPRAPNNRKFEQTSGSVTTIDGAASDTSRGKEQANRVAARANRELEGRGKNQHCILRMLLLIISIHLRIKIERCRDSD
jgi:hypothetical protein